MQSTQVEISMRLNANPPRLRIMIMMMKIACFQHQRTQTEHVCISELGAFRRLGWSLLEKFYDLQSKECKLQKPSTPINPIEAHRIWYLIRAGMRWIFWILILTYRTSRKHWNSAETPLRHLWDTAEKPFVDEDNGDGDVDDYVDVGDWWWQWRWR